MHDARIRSRSAKEALTEGVFVVQDSKDHANASLGIQFRTPSLVNASTHDVHVRAGTMVDILKPDSPLQGSLRVGDVILSINGVPVSDAHGKGNAACGMDNMAGESGG